MKEVNWLLHDAMLNKFRTRNKIKTTSKNFNRKIKKGNIMSTVAQLRQEVRSYQRAIDEALFILCQGRTFYESYFDDYDNLGRIDKAVFLLSKVMPTDYQK